LHSDSNVDDGRLMTASRRMRLCARWAVGACDWASTRCVQRHLPGN